MGTGERCVPPGGPSRRSRLDGPINGEMFLAYVEQILVATLKPGDIVISTISAATTFTAVLIKNAITISMDGKGAWRDNVFVERLWRSVKYEEVYLRAYDSVSDARASVGRYLSFYNGRRPHSSLDGMTPDQAYFAPLPLRLAA
jgi:hypothetical protein